MQAELKQLEGEEYVVDHSPTPRKLNRSQKAAFAVLAFLTVVVIGSWYAQFKYNLDYSNKRNTTVAGLDKTSELCPSGNCAEEDSEEALKKKDTDKDGLTDWEEINTYFTSPYIADSDSDGFSDKKEIDSENDPLCPKGKECHAQTGAEAEADGNTTVSDEVLGGDEILQTLDDMSSELETENSTTTSSDLLGGNMDAGTLRKMLLESGFSQDLLNQLSDEALLESYRQTLEEQQQ